MHARLLARLPVLLKLKGAIRQNKRIGSTTPFLRHPSWLTIDRHGYSQSTTTTISFV